MSKIRAIIWVHALRLSRYKYGFINYILVNLLWYLIFLLGALTFVPSENYIKIAIITFWGIIEWSMMENAVWLIAGWTWFVLVTGLAEEHMIHNVNPLTFISGRFITGSAISFVTIPLIMLIFAGIIGEYIFTCRYPQFLILGIILVLAYATLYGLILASIGLRLEIPGTMLDITNVLMYIVGGLGVPVSMMPPVLREISLLLPYTHAAELTRYGVLGIEPYLGLWVELVIAIVYLCVLILLTIFIIKKIIRYILVHGVRAVGMM